MQRIGRANHRLDEPSRAVLIPANRFEVLECRVAIDAIAENAQDTPPLRTGALDVLAQHILGCACGEPFLSDELYAEVLTAAPYASLTRTDFDDVVDFVATGGYALKTYERFARIKQDKQGRWRVANPKVRQSYRLNVGTIVEDVMMKVRLVRGRGGGKGSTGVIARGGRMLGEIEEAFIEGLVLGDTFVFGGEVVRYEALAEDVVYVSRANDKDAKVPSYMGGKFPLSTYLAERVRKLLDDRRQWNALPEQVRDWLSLQKDVSRVPAVRELLIETFPRSNKHYLVCYPFEGRLAHQTLGMLLTRRMERMGLKPLGFVATDYVLGIWGLRPPTKQQLDQLFDEDMLGDDLEAWMDESTMLRRSFRNVAVIAGLIERRFPGEEKSRRQVTFSSDLIYDALRRHEPDHILLRATRQDAAWQLADLRRLGDLLRRAKGRIDYRRLERISPLAVPVLLEIGKERVLDGTAEDELLDIAAQELIDEATRL
jgi:ATP-dependent Lhr-like helicase